MENPAAAMEAAKKEKEEKIKKLTGEEFYNRYEQFENQLKMFDITAGKYNDAQSGRERRRNAIIETVQKGESPSEALAELDEFEKRDKRNTNEYSAMEASVENIKDFCKEYELDVDIHAGMSSEDFVKEIEKAQHAKLFEARGM